MVAERTYNRNLNKAKAKKDDEFYTYHDTVWEELKHYERHFRGARVLCNCDDPGWDNDEESRISEFFRYFDLNFKVLSLQRLIGVRYAGSTLFPGITGGAKAYKRLVTSDKNGNKHKTPPILLKGDGSFASAECVKFLRDADIVCTNPPFSRFREFVRLLMAHDKQFLIIGNMNAVGYKDIFPLIQSGKMWMGVSNASQYPFIRPDGKEQKLGFACWFTNLPHERREREEITLTEDYNPAHYPKYDNYPAAIEVKRMADIPDGYDGEMGVSVSFLEKHNPNQFEIVGRDEDLLGQGGGGRFYVKGKRMYARIVIRHKKRSAK